MADKLEIKVAFPKVCKKLLLHSCCAPCSCDIIRRSKEANIDFAVVCYNPNIDTREEYDRRKEEIKNYTYKLGISFYDLDYENDLWKERVKGLENEPEKGRRCDVCFDIRMERCALFAHENRYDVFTSSIGISRYKDFNQITLSGQKAASRYEGLIYWDYNWRKQGGLEKSETLSKQEGFYRQKYCGCAYSKR